MATCLSAKPMLVALQDVGEQLRISLALDVAWSGVRLGGHEGGRPHGSAVPASGRPPSSRIEQVSDRSGLECPTPAAHPVQSADGEAKYWIEPSIELARNHGLSAQDLRRVEQLIEEHEEEIRNAWSDHFGS
jgi:hypothetical protein